jgi:hypothetical protein
MVEMKVNGKSRSIGDLQVHFENAEPSDNGNPAEARRENNYFFQTQVDPATHGTSQDETRSANMDYLYPFNDINLHGCGYHTCVCEHG